jgi:hypothetical protein
MGSLTRYEDQIGTQNVQISGPLPLPVEEQNPITEIEITNQTPIEIIEPISGPFRKDFSPSGSTSMNQNWSVTSGTFGFEPTRDFLLTGVYLAIGAFATAPLGHNKFGGINTLSNGIQLNITSNGAALDAFNKRTFKSNPQIMLCASKWQVFDFTAASGDGEYLWAYFDFKHLGKGGVQLFSDTNDQVYVTLTDNMSGNNYLTEMGFEGGYID